jgi:hypothetical protein
MSRNAPGKAFPLAAAPNDIHLSFGGDKGCWEISSEEGAVRTAAGRTRLHVDGKWITLFDGASPAERRQPRGPMTIRHKKDGLAAELTVAFPAGVPGAVLQVELRNESTGDKVLGPLHVLELDDMVTGCPADELKVFVESGGGWWAGVTDIESSSPYKEQWDLLPDEDKPLAREWLGREAGDGFHNSVGGLSALHSAAAGGALIMGFLTFLRASSNVTWLYRKEDEHLSGWAGCDFAGHRLKTGERIVSEKLFLGVYRSPFDGLEAYATLAGAAMKVKLPSMPPMGWCSWYAYRLKVTEEIVLQSARLIKKHFGGYPFEYVQVDHGWQFRDICGHWLETNDRFPHGIEWLAGQLKKLGYKTGLWLGAFCLCESAPVMKEHPEFATQSVNGGPRCSPYTWPWPPHERLYTLDPTHPGAQRFLKRSFGGLRRAGVRYWKVDFTWGIADAAKDCAYYDPTAIKGAETYRKGCGVVSKAVEGDYLYWCSNPINLGYGLSATSMTACDIGNTGFRLAKAVEGRTEDLNFFRQNLTTIGARLFMHKRLFLINPDVVEVGGLGDIEEGKIRLTLVALAGGQVFLGDVLTELKQKHWDLLEKCIPPYGHAARPVDLFEHSWPSSYPHIWHLPVKTAWGRWEVVGLFNLTTGPAETTVEFASLGLEADRDYLVYEFWSKRFIGRRRNSVTVPMKPATTQLLMVREAPEHPMVLSTDMHYTQGGMDLAGVRYDAKSQTLTGTARRQKGSRGNVIIYVPNGYAARRARGIKAKGRNLVVLPLIFRGAEVNWSVRFRSQR